MIQRSRLEVPDDQQEGCLQELQLARVTDYLRAMDTRMTIQEEVKPDSPTF